MSYDPNARAYVPDVASAGDSKKRKKKGKSEFLVNLPYFAHLPSLGIGRQGKMQVVKLDPARHTDYCGANLEHVQRHSLMSDVHLGMPIDLVNLDKYTVHGDASGEMAADDLALVKDASQLVDSSLASTGVLSIAERDARSEVKKEGFHWLEGSKLLQNATHGLMAKANTNSMKRSRILIEQSTDKFSKELTRDEQVALIENTFVKAKSVDKLRHPVKKKMKMTKVIPLFPGALNRTEEAPLSFKILKTLPTDADLRHVDTLEGNQARSTRPAVQRMKGSLITTHDKSHHSLYVMPSVSQTAQYVWCREYSSMNAPMVNPKDRYLIAIGNESMRFYEYANRQRLQRESADSTVETRPASVAFNDDE